MEGVTGDAELVGDLPRAVLERLRSRDGPVEADDSTWPRRSELGAGLTTSGRRRVEVGDGGVDGLEQLACSPESDDLVDGPADAVDLARARPQLSDAGRSSTSP